MVAVESLSGDNETAWKADRTKIIDSLLNLLFRCPHRRLTRPVTPVSLDGKPHGDTYVVCLDCGKQFSYDLKEMRIGKALPNATGTGVLSPEMPAPRPSKVKVAAVASVLPLGIALGSLLTSRRHRKRELRETKPDEPAQPPQPPQS
jgi:hypothetical protein